MMERRSKAVRRTVALALLGLVVALVVLLVVAPLAGRLSDLDAEVLDARLVLGRFEAEAARQDAVPDAERLARAASESGVYLKGESEPIRAANLQTVLAELAGRAGIRFHSARTLPQRERDDARTVGVGVQFTCAIEQLRQLLFDIEAGKPFLFVEGLHVRPVAAFAQRDRELGGLLEVHLEIYGAVPRNRG